MTEYLDGYRDWRDPAITSIFDELSFWSSRFGALLLDELPLPRRATVLDVGCGTGFPLFELAHSAGSSNRYVGLDLWRQGLARARWKRGTYDLDRVRLVEADGARMPFRDGCFDLVVSNLGINNFEQPEQVLGECARVSRPGAVLALTTNPTGHMRELYAAFSALLEERGEKAAVRRLAVQESHRGSEERLLSWLSAAGFDSPRVVRSRFCLRYSDGSAMLRHSLTRFGFLPGWCEVVEPAQRREVFGELERRLNRMADAEGELRLTVPALYVEASKP